MTTVEYLIAFEREVADLFAAQRIKGPVHLSGGNERELIELFADIAREDWVFSSYRNHYHALLHGVPRDLLLRRIIEGHSMTLQWSEYRFFCSAIVGGCLPIATGVAYALKRAGSAPHVWCFVGDMAATTGAFHEARRYAMHNDLPITFVIEDNGMSCDSPTAECWGTSHPRGSGDKRRGYIYTRTYPHVGIGRNVF